MRNQRRILQLAAHQLVYHMPMPCLLLDREPEEQLRTQSAETKQSVSGEEPIHQDSGKKPLLRFLLSEGIYEVITSALCAWVLVSVLRSGTGTA